jgi:hypothetical protein
MGDFSADKPNPAASYGDSSKTSLATSQKRFRAGFNSEQHNMAPNRVDQRQGREMYQMNFNAPGEWGPNGLWGAATQIPGQWTHEQ